MRSAYFMFPSFGVWVRLYDERAAAEGTTTRAEATTFGVGASMTRVQSAAKGRSGTT
jgi:hypothetical protein